MPSLLLSMAESRELALESYVLSGTPREKEGSRTLEPGLRLSMSLQFIFFVACLYRLTEP